MNISPAYEELGGVADDVPPRKPPAARGVGAPAAKMGHVAETAALHVLIGNFHHELRTQRFPGEVFALTPAAVSARHPLTRLGYCIGPCTPGMILERVFAVRREEVDQFHPLLLRKTGADADVL